MVTPIHTRVEEIKELLHTADISCVTKKKVYKFTYAWEINNIQELFYNLNLQEVNSSKFSIDEVTAVTFNLSVSREHTTQIGTRARSLKSLGILRSTPRKLDKLAFLLIVNNPLLVYAQISVEFIIVNNKMEVLGSNNTKFVLTSRTLYSNLFLINEFNFNKITAINCYCSIEIESITSMEQKDQIEKLLVTLKKDFKTLLETSDFSDFTCVVQNKSFNVHKAIICSRVPTFFKQGPSFTDNHENVSFYEKNKISSQAFYEFLKYIYYGEIENLDSVYYELFLLAEYYEVEDLKIVCTSYLRSNICLENIHKVIDCIVTKKVSDLEKELIVFLKINKKKFLKSYTYSRVLSSFPDYMQKILKIL